MRTEESSFNVWLKQRRRAIDLTQEDLSECVGCSTTTIQKIELGQRRPSKQMALRLAECLSVPMEEHEAFLSFARGGVEAEARTFSKLHEPALPSMARLHSRVERAPHITPHNLTLSLTRLLGREDTVASAIRYLLKDGLRLLTFTGAPGIGKTRLSRQTALDSLPYFQEVTFVELAPVTDPTLVPSAIAATLELVGESSALIQQSLKQYVGDKKMLLVLDNFEQVLDAAPLLVDLLSTCPNLKVLVTSREALHVPGEQQFPVPPLDLPDPQRLPDLDTLSQYAAVALFLERAMAADPGFALTDANAREVCEVCARLEGIPLAIELAAARVTLLSTAEMAARLDKQLSLLTGPGRYARSERGLHLPPRQQTMRAAIGWSYQLLEPDERRLLLRLGVFVGGWTLEAAEAVCGPDAGDGMQSLLEKNLLKRPNANAVGVERERRFTMLESIREYALEQLEEGGELMDARRSHNMYFLDLVERAEPHFMGESQVEWFQRLEREHDNLLAALAWTIANDKDAALRFGGSLRSFWHDRYLAEGRRWVEGVFAGYPDEGSASITRVKALMTAAMVLRKTREYEQAKRMYEECVSIYRALGDRNGTANALRLLGHLAFETNLPGDKELATRYLEESLSIYRATGYSRGLGNILNSLGEAARAERDYPKAIALFEESMAITREMSDAYSIAVVANNLGFVLYSDGQLERARLLMSEAVRLLHAAASAFNTSGSLFGMAGIIRGEGDPRRAAIVIGAADTLAATGGTIYDPNEQRDREEIEAAVMSDLSEEEWQRALEQGRKMGFDEAVSFALGDASGNASV